jgi:hypothetical protein
VLRQRDETKRGLHDTARKMVKGNLNVILRLGTNNNMTKHAWSTCFFSADKYLSDWLLKYST